VSSRDGRFPGGLNACERLPSHLAQHGILLRHDCPSATSGTRGCQKQHTMAVLIRASISDGKTATIVALDYRLQTSLAHVYYNRR
jgi:hypothetical protein